MCCRTPGFTIRNTPPVPRAPRRRSHVTGRDDGPARVSSSIEIVRHAWLLNVNTQLSLLVKPLDASARISPSDLNQKSLAISRLLDDWIDTACVALYCKRGPALFGKSSRESNRVSLILISFFFYLFLLYEHCAPRSDESRLYLSLFNIISRARVSFFFLLRKISLCTRVEYMWSYKWSSPQQGDSLFFPSNPSR